MYGVNIKYYYVVVLREVRGRAWMAGNPSSCSAVFMQIRVDA